MLTKQERRDSTEARLADLETLRPEHTLSYIAYLDQAIRNEFKAVYRGGIISKKLDTRIKNVMRQAVGQRLGMNL